MKSAWLHAFVHYAASMSACLAIACVGYAAGGTDLQGAWFTVTFALALAVGLFASVAVTNRLIQAKTPNWTRTTRISVIVVAALAFCIALVCVGLLLLANIHEVMGGGL